MVANYFASDLLGPCHCLLFVDRKTRHSSRQLTGSQDGNNNSRLSIRFELRNAPSAAFVRYSQSRLLGGIVSLGEDQGRIRLPVDEDVLDDP